MEIIFILGILAIILALLNAIILIVRMVQRRITFLMGIAIVAASAFIPYGLAVLISSFYAGWSRMGVALISWTISGLIGMFILFIYLAGLKEVEIPRKENPDLLDD